MIAYLPPVIAVAEGPSEPVGPSNVGLGAVVLTIAVGVFLAWIGYLIINSRRRTRTPEAAPPNQEFFMDNEGLENDRLTRVLTAAVVSAAVLAIVMPIYYVNESRRQEAAAEEIREEYIHFGEEWWIKFECSVCHGPDGGGGGAEITEDRSGLTANWAAPSLDDVFYRYNEEEVRHWIVYGRQGSPMPNAGLEGGGAMTVQEVDQVIEFMRDLEVSQMEAFSRADSLVQTALDRIANGQATIEARLVVENTKLQDIREAPARFSAIRKVPDDIDALLSGPGTCTSESAAMVGKTCSSPGTDTDRDGVTDEAETALTALAQLAYDVVVSRSVDSQTLEVSEVQDAGFDVSFSPTSAFSTQDASGNPLADIDAVEEFMSHFDARYLELSLIADRVDVFAEPVEEGIAYLEDALEQRAWDVDFGEVAAATGLSTADATRSVGLFNAYCARCHTAGYSAGVEFEQEPGSGAWAPALTDGRTVIQFPDEADHIQFIINGANAAEGYGVNGLSGVGGMPAFGAILSQEDIELIVKYERSM